MPNSHKKLVEGPQHRQGRRIQAATPNMCPNYAWCAQSIEPLCTVQVRNAEESTNFLLKQCLYKPK